jgi:hypothetical protein
MLTCVVVWVRNFLLGAEQDDPICAYVASDQPILAGYDGVPGSKDLADRLFTLSPTVVSFP